MNELKKRARYTEDWDDELLEDVKFNTVNRIQKQQEKPQKHVKWMVRLRDAQKQYFEIESQKETFQQNLMAIIIEESEVKLTMASVERRLSVDESWKKFNQELKYLEADIGFLKESVKVINNLGFDLKTLVDMMNQEENI